jgi:hypothetical protein
MSATIRLRAPRDERKLIPARDDSGVADLSRRIA